MSPHATGAGRYRSARYRPLAALQGGLPIICHKGSVPWAVLSYYQGRASATKGAIRRAPVKKGAEYSTEAGGIGGPKDPDNDSPLALSFSGVLFASKRGYVGFDENPQEWIVA